MISRKNSAQFLLIGALIIAGLIAVIASRRAARFEESTPAETEVTDSTMPESGSGPASETSPVAASAAAAMETGSPQKLTATAQLKILNEILDSKNDNDPRLDQDLRELNAEAKLLLREKYKHLPFEKRNQRGLIVFLLGRNLNEAADFDFLQSVLSEPPCLSLANCTMASPNANGSGVGLAAAYPQLVALQALSGYLQKRDSFSVQLKDRAIEILNSERQSATAEVQNQAEKIITSLKK